MKLNQLILFLIYFSLFASCKKNQLLTPSCDGSNPTYDDTIASIIDQNCLQCHGYHSSHGNFSTFSGLMTVISNGKFEQEVLIEQTMPSNGSLSQEHLNIISCWVENGYPEN